MINLSKEEFDGYIEDLINEKYSKADLLKILQTDYRTLNNKIQDLAISNPDLYLRYIKKFPYRQKERDDIDYEALVIEVIKTGIYAQDIASKYGISVKTVQRKVAKLEKDNPELIELYRLVRQNNKINAPSGAITPEVREKIDLLVRRPVKISDVNDSRREHLLEIEKLFYERKMQYGTVAAAARSMGTTPDRIYKLLNELYRIDLERKTLEENTSNGTSTSKLSDFKEKLKFTPLEGESKKVDEGKDNKKSSPDVPEI